jgi:hypothetical protein
MSLYSENINLPNVTDEANMAEVFFHAAHTVISGNNYYLQTEGANSRETVQVYRSDSHEVPVPQLIQNYPSMFLSESELRASINPDDFTLDPENVAPSQQQPTFLGEPLPEIPPQQDLPATTGTAADLELEPEDQ